MTKTKMVGLGHPPTWTLTLGIKADRVYLLEKPDVGKVKATEGSKNGCKQVSFLNMISFKII